MIAIIDYGVGNLFSLASSLKSLGLETKVTRDAAAIRAADHIILPGVGAFADAMAEDGLKREDIFVTSKLWNNAGSGAQTAFGHLPGHAAAV